MFKGEIIFQRFHTVTDKTASCRLLFIFMVIFPDGNCANCSVKRTGRFG